VLPHEQRRNHSEPLVDAQQGARTAPCRQGRTHRVSVPLAHGDALGLEPPERVGGEVMGTRGQASEAVGCEL